jgi:hypothetical protein
MAPGAEVREQPDGSVSVNGVLHAAARAEMARAHQLAGQWPARPCVSIAFDEEHGIVLLVPMPRTPDLRMRRDPACMHPQPSGMRGTGSGSRHDRERQPVVLAQRNVLRRAILLEPRQRQSSRCELCRKLFAAPNFRDGYKKGYKMDRAAPHQ